ncbi:cuticle protein 10.9 [Rhipicephalus sanguineus]|uniref:cuticle protein 10.9 n=1 Tax=Rhipicephalus sanguineus TaxID=34632 RepID=UPI0018934F7C|nr:cuticle protein 10.9 [Rhipicephalus sanguineus]
MLLEPSQPYSFGYDNVDAFGYRQFRSEQGDSNNAKTSSYGYRDMSGLYRRVNYVADAYGFHATVDTNEPGTAPGASAGVVFNAAPVVQPFSSGGAQSGARTGFAATAVAPYNVYAARDPALVGTTYGGQLPYGYGAASYGPGVYEALDGYGSVAAHHGFRRR